MTPDTLRTLVREDAGTTEPALSLTADDVLRGGRRRLRRRRAVSGLAGLAVAAVVAVAVPSLAGGGSPTVARLDAASQAALERYDAQLMPALVDETVRRAVAGTAPPFEHAEVEAQESQGRRLPPTLLRHTSMWVGSYDWGSDHRLRVALLHSGSESEGDVDRYCQGQVEAHVALSCTVARDDQGRPVVSEVSVVRLSEGVAADPGQQTWQLVLHPERGNPGRLWFQRSVEVRRGGIYLTSVTETVRAPDLSAAQRAWHLDPITLRTIATAPALVFPAPDPDEHGCDYVLGNEDGAYSCTSSVPSAP
jgi:hypothetical protein